jgi:hypothetical protein
VLMLMGLGILGGRRVAFRNRRATGLSSKTSSVG